MLEQSLEALYVLLEPREADLNEACTSMTSSDFADTCPPKDTASDTSSTQKADTSSTQKADCWPGAMLVRDRALMCELVRILYRLLMTRDHVSLHLRAFQVLSLLLRALVRHTDLLRAQHLASILAQHNFPRSGISFHFIVISIFTSLINGCRQPDLALQGSHRMKIHGHNIFDKISNYILDMKVFRYLLSLVSKSSQ